MSCQVCANPVRWNELQFGSAHRVCIERLLSKPQQSADGRR